MDPKLAQELLAELGVTADALNTLCRMSFEQAQLGLEGLKEQAKARYRKLAFKYHPDRNPGDAEAEARFKALGSVLQEINSLEVRRPSTPPMFFPTWSPFTRPPVDYAEVVNSVNTGTSTTSSSWGPRVVFIRFW